MRTDWAYANRQKEVGGMVARNPEQIVILYECACDNAKKVNHHFNYKYPFLVIRLCYKCHAAEHARLRKLYPHLRHADILYTA